MCSAICHPVPSVVQYPVKYLQETRLYGLYTHCRAWTYYAHGGGFTLFTEIKPKYDGYGIAASEGSTAGDINAEGGHLLC